jgi:hypothetical protein
MKTLIKMSMLFFLLSGMAMADCTTYSEVRGYKMGCPFIDESFQQTYQKNDLARYEKQLDDGVFDTVEVYILNGSIEGIDFTAARSMTDEEKANILQLVHTQYGETQDDGFGAYSVNIDEGMLAMINFLPDASANDGKASLLYLSKIFMVRLEKSNLAAQ